MSYPDPANQRAVAGLPFTPTWQAIGADGEPADPGTVTVTITRADGSVVRTAAATSGTTSDARTLTTPLTVAETKILDRLTCVWSVGADAVGTTYIDVVAAPWFSNNTLRTVEKSLQSEASYPASAISLARVQVEAFFERVTNRRFVPGYALKWVEGTCRDELILPDVDIRTIRSIKVYDDLAANPIETFTATDLQRIRPTEEGVICRYTGTWDSRWVQIGYEYGLNTPPPDVSRQGMRLVREILNETKSQIPDSATTWNSTDLGWSAVLLTPGIRGAHTRLPSVNECLDAWTFEQIALA